MTIPRFRAIIVPRGRGTSQAQSMPRGAWPGRLRPAEDRGRHGKDTQVCGIPWEMDVTPLSDVSCRSDGSVPLSRRQRRTGDHDQYEGPGLLFHWAAPACSWLGPCVVGKTLSLTLTDEGLIKFAETPACWIFQESGPGTGRPAARLGSPESRPTAPLGGTACGRCKVTGSLIPGSYAASRRHFVRTIWARSSMVPPPGKVYFSVTMNLS